jgi:hypothetical protein
MISKSEELREGSREIGEIGDGKDEPAADSSSEHLK